MKKSITLVAIAALFITVYSCKKNSSSSVSGGQVSLSLPSTPDNYFPNSFNADSMNRIATLGRVLFYDGHLSANNATSCGSCHRQVYGFADNEQFSTGFQGMKTRRNTPGISGLHSMFGTLFWDGREDNLQNLIMRPITNHVEMGIDDAGVLPAKLSALPYYPALFKSAYGDEGITVARISRAVATFVQAIAPTTNKSRLEEFVDGNASVLTAQEIQGKELFDVKYNCQSCHTSGGPSPYSGGFSSTFRDIGLDQNYTDPGRGAVTGITADKGTFKVPSLRNVALTAPYMHDGRYKTLEEVVDHYSENIMPSQNLDTLLRSSDGRARQFNITADDKAALVAFLKTLTDYKTLNDPKFSNPFKVNN